MASSNSAVASLTASDALAGSELFYADGLASAAPADVKVTSTQIKTWTSASPTLVTPALGTPASGNLASCTGYPQTSLAGIGGVPGYIEFKAVVDFNVGNTDTAIALTMPTGITRYGVNAVRISGASASISTATVGVFTGAGGTGVTIVTAATAITVTSASENTANNSQTLAQAITSTTSLNATTIFVRVATAQGSAATATVTITINPLS